MPRRHDPLGLIEELDRYGNRVEIDDPEFEAKVRAKIGAPYISEVDRNVAYDFPNAFRPTRSYSTLGLNAGDIPIDKREKAVRNDIGLAALKNYDPSKYVFAFGAGATPQTYAHEFRHNKIDDEEQNRIADLKNSTSAYQYASNIQSLYEYLYRDDGKDLPFQVREKRVLNRFIDPWVIDRHKNINRGEQGEVREFMSHPIDYMQGKRYEDPYKKSTTRLTKGTLQERSEVPFLSFVGREDLPDPLFAEEKGMYRRTYGTNAENAKALVDAIKKSESKQKKAAGGAIENTTHYRKMI